MVKMGKEAKTDEELSSDGFKWAMAEVPGAILLLLPCYKNKLQMRFLFPRQVLVVNQGTGG
jgi:hypothetical protein